MLYELVMLFRFMILDKLNKKNMTYSHELFVVTVFILPVINAHIPINAHFSDLKIKSTFMVHYIYIRKLL